jgi:hypothetical protein
MKNNHVGPHDLRGITQEISVPLTNKSATSAVITNSIKNEEENTSLSDYKAPHTKTFGTIQRVSARPNNVPASIS